MGIYPIVVVRGVGAVNLESWFEVTTTRGKPEWECERRIDRGSLIADKYDRSSETYIYTQDLETPVFHLHNSIRHY